MIANPTAEEITLETNLSEAFDVYLIDAEHFLTKEALSSSRLTIGANQVIYMKNF